MTLPLQAGEYVTAATTFRDHMLLFTNYGRVFRCVWHHESYGYTTEVINGGGR